METDKKEETQTIKPLLQMFLSHYQEIKILFPRIPYHRTLIISQITQMVRDKTSKEQKH